MSGFSTVPPGLPRAASSDGRRSGCRLRAGINEFVPYSRIGWYGYAPGTAPAFYHTWYLQPRGDGCLAVTDEVGKGSDARHLRETDEDLMHRGHDLWLATLRWVSENK
jgi:hypothetical protein